jgi:hypothetical protein
MYNKLMKCRSIATIEHYKQEHFKNMKLKDIAYLNSLTDESQYPAARCAMSLLIYLYHWSSSGTVESMNKANKEMRARTAVDLLNACILLIELECGWFNKMKQDAWGGTSVLTPWGLQEYEATFTNLSASHFIFNLHGYDEHWQVRVLQHNVPGAREQIVNLPKSPINGSYFETCTCGADRTDAVTCEHMAAIAPSSVIRPQITPLNVMPMWWKRKQWRVQFPSDMYADANIIIKSLKDDRSPDHSLRLCPDWTATGKSGCPKKGERIKSGLETAMVKGMPGTEKTKAIKRQRCMVCGKFGHSSEGCWLLEKSEDTQPVVVNTFPIQAEDIDDDGKEASV